MDGPLPLHFAFKACFTFTSFPGQAALLKLNFLHSELNERLSFSEIVLSVVVLL